MDDRRTRRLLRTEALIVAYAMSRLDRRYLDHFRHATWKAGFTAAARWQEKKCLHAGLNSGRVIPRFLPEVLT